MTSATSLLASMLAVQKSLPENPIRKDKGNPQFKSKYASLDAVMDAILPALSNNGLVWTTLPGLGPNGEPTLTYQLLHAETGEQISGEMPLLLGKNDSQGLGSAITYARRYSIMSVLGLTADEDDDGNAASRPQKVAAAPARQQNDPTAEPVKQSETPASAKQKGLLNGRASDAGLTAQEYAMAILAAAEVPGRTFESDEDAQQFVHRSLDRLPMRLVDPLLETITAMGASKQASLLDGAA